jgi:hypothetical protein
MGFQNVDQAFLLRSIELWGHQYLWSAIALNSAGKKYALVLGEQSNLCRLIYFKFTLYGMGLGYLQPTQASVLAKVYRISSKVF